MIPNKTDQFTTRNADMMAHKNSLERVCYAWKKAGGVFIGRVYNRFKSTPMKIEFSTSPLKEIRSKFEQKGWEVTMITEKETKKELHKAYNLLTSEVKSIDDSNSLIKNPKTILKPVFDNHKDKKWYGTKNKNLAGNHCKKLIQKSFKINMDEEKNFLKEHNIEILSYQKSDEKKLTKTILKPTKSNKWEIIFSKEYVLRDIDSKYYNASKE